MAKTTAIRHPRVTIASKACDGCRLRKVKCELLDGDPLSASTSSLKACRRCSKLKLSCTFDLPSRARGPRRREEGLQTGTSERTTREDAQSNSEWHQPLYDVPATAIATPDSATHFPQGHTPHYVVDGNIPDQSPASSNNAHYQQLITETLTPTRIPQQYQTDRLCSRILFRRIMNDYLNHLYPLIPVVHRPSFCQDLASNRDTNDTDFLGLIIALCATVVAALPSKFKEYRLSRTPIRFETREEMINCCHAMLLNLRGPHYFDEINFRKFAASYLMTIAFLQLGEYNRARMMEVEMMQLGRLLHIHKISEYEGLNCIETQLRKKGFWLIFYTQVHEQLQNLRKERLMYFDEALLNSVDLEELLPLEVDDEFIFEDRVLNPSQTTCLTTGFIIHSRVFWTALKSPKSRDVSTPMEQYCQCVRSTHPDAQINYLKARLQDLKYMLDSVPIQLRQWAPPDSNTETKDKEIYSSHFRTMRANLHVTHLWLQSIIIDQIETLEQQQQHCHRSPTDQHHQNPHLYPSLTWWSTREEICRQLLHVLHNIPMANLEPNGLHLTHKIRDVAVGLLTCPFEAHEPASIRAAEYVTEFTEILSRLDTSEKVNTTSLQSWVDTDRVKGSGKGRRDIWNSNWDR